jgi:DNA (cytosine-5)-methyltransferase 1
MFSRLANLVRANGHEPRFGNLIPEYERVVAEAAPAWFLMENVPAAPVPVVDGYEVREIMLDNRWVGGEQMRKRRFSFGTRDGRPLAVDYVALEEPVAFETVISGNGFGNDSEYYKRVGQAVISGAPPLIGGSGKIKRTATTVTSSDGGGSVKMVRYSIGEATRLQGLSEDFLADAPFTKGGKLKAIANGVPLPMGRAIAKAVKAAIVA